MVYPPDVDLEFDWHLTNRCNFDCVYCHPQIKYVLNKRYSIEPPWELVVNRFNELGRVCAIHMSGGEPFLYPGFINLCIGLTEMHYISINTNLSVKHVNKFATVVNPNRVSFINAALHQSERERLGIKIKDFISKVLLLQEKGFSINAIYIVYPPLLDRFINDIAILANAGVKNISARSFKGIFNERMYPQSYTEVEKSKIISHSGTYEFNKAYLEGLTNFSGMSCTAGQKSFKIEVTGQVHRCATIKGNYGNFYDGTFKPSLLPERCSEQKALAISQCHRYLVNSLIKLHHNE